MVLWNAYITLETIASDWPEALAMREYRSDWLVFEPVGFLAGTGHLLPWVSANAVKMRFHSAGIHLFRIRECPKATNPLQKAGESHLTLCPPSHGFG